jgi:hypothetical protein
MVKGALDILPGLEKQISDLEQSNPITSNS